MNDNDENIQIDRSKLGSMLLRIVMLERENIKTKQYNDRDMRAKIREIIEKEAE